jgi:hypothetical protein
MSNAARIPAPAADSAFDVEYSLAPAGARRLDPENTFACDDDAEDGADPVAPTSLKGRNEAVTAWREYLAVLAAGHDFRSYQGRTDFRGALIKGTKDLAPGYLRLMVRWLDMPTTNLGGTRGGATMMIANGWIEHSQREAAKLASQKVMVWILSTKGVRTEVESKHSFADTRATMTRLGWIVDTDTPTTIVAHHPDRGRAIAFVITD